MQYYVLPGPEILVGPKSENPKKNQEKKDEIQAEIPELACWHLDSIDSISKFETLV